MSRRWLLAFALPLALALAIATAVAADLDNYRASLEDASTALREPDPDPERALAVLYAIEPVILDDGTTIDPDLAPIINALEDPRPDIAAARQGIDAILAALDLAERSDAIDADAASAALERVLAREEFQPEPEEDQSTSLRQRVSDGIGNAITSALEWLSGKLGGSVGEGSPLSLVMSMLGIVVVVTIVAFAVQSVRRSMGPGVTRLADGDAEAHYSSAEARAEAERLFAAGDYRAALRLLYLATLIRWEEAGRLRFERSLTNREVVARVTIQGDASLLEQLTPLVERFDRVWYGGAACTSDDYRRFAALADRAWEVAQ